MSASKATQNRVCGAIQWGALAIARSRLTQRHPFFEAPPAVPGHTSERALRSPKKGLAARFWFRTVAATAAAALVSLRALTTVEAACPPAAGDCQPLLENGSLAAAIDLVIVGDGYTAAEKDKFFQDAKNVAEGLFASETYGTYAPVFNAWALYKESGQSGADHPSAGKFVDTAFGASYDTSGIDYLLAVTDGKVLSEVNNRFPESDVILCIVNDTDYGGSGGTIAVMSLDPNALEIARHELGHTLTDLADEYTAPYPGYPEGDPEANVASAAHLNPPKWELWLTPGVMIPTPISAAQGTSNPIGAYEGARYKETGVFRPAPNCLMRELDIPFCSVCAEAMVKQFSTMSLLIDAPDPAGMVVIPGKGPSVFTATIPALSDLVFSWAVDGQPIEGSSKSLGIDPSKLNLADGPHTVTLTVVDATPLVRNDPSDVMRESYTWNVGVDSKLPPATGSGGAGGTGGSGGAGGSAGAGVGAGASGETGGETNSGACACRAAAASSKVPWGFLALGMVPLALRRRLFPRRPK